jgi:hypothetical protein
MSTPKCEHEDHDSILHNNPKLEAIQAPINLQMGKPKVVYPFNRILPSKKKE